MEISILFLPLIASIISGFFGNFLGSRNSEILTSLFVSISSIFSFFIFYKVFNDGYTNNLENRLSLHNSSKGAKFTRGRKWKLIYKEKIETKSKAISRESYIKKNRKLRNLLKN